MRSISSLYIIFALSIGCAAEQNRKPVPSGADKQVKVPPPSPASAEARASSEPVIDSGGELDLAQLPAATVTRMSGEIVAYGLAESPGDSRLQAALELADANARAELIGAIRVGVAAELQARTDEGQKGGGSTEIEQRTAQVADGVLPALGAAQHGWRKVRRNGEIILITGARIAAREDALLQTLAATLKGSPDPAARAHAVLEAMGQGKPLGAQ